MAKKEQTINYPQEDLDNMLKLFKHVGPLYSEQQEFIYQMLRKYIDPNHWRPMASCNCSMSYAVAFNKLREWVSQNSNKFQ